MRSARSSEFISSFILKSATQSTSQSLIPTIAVLPQHKEQRSKTPRSTESTQIHRIHAIQGPWFCGGS